jgi:hypothetical protein
VSDVRMRIDVIDRSRNVELVAHVFRGQPYKGARGLIPWSEPNV